MKGICEMEFEHNHRNNRGTEGKAIREHSQDEQSYYAESFEQYPEPESELDFSIK